MDAANRTGTTGLVINMGVALLAVLVTNALISWANPGKCLPTARLR